MPSLVLAIDAQTASKALVVAAAGFVGLAIVSAFVMKKIVTKIASLVILLGLGVLMWSQRVPLQDCLDGVQAATSVEDLDTTCTVFGRELTVPTSMIPDRLRPPAG